MGGLSIWHWLIALAVALLLFGGRGKIKQIMGDTAEGIKAFKKGIKDDKDKVETDTAGKVIDNSATQKDNAA
jgi:sec-independent protein translocase protein TatA